MRKLFKERKLFKGGNYMRKYGTSNRKGKIFPSFNQKKDLTTVWFRI